MKIILQDNKAFVLRFDKGEDVMEGLPKFMKEQGIQACTFFGIGTCETPEIAFYNPHVKEYRKKVFLEELEIVSFSGNGATKDGEPVVHAHGIFAKNDFSTVGGHVFKMQVTVMCEIHLTKLDGEMKRETNADLNLNSLV